MSSNKPFPSSDLDVFKENSLILDNFVNSQENEHPDRFNRKRPTITGIIKEAFNVRTDISNMNETLIGQSRWDAVPKNTSLTLGGDNGALNKQAQALFNRTIMLKVHAREALRRTYLEAGYNLVEGSFEQGAVITSTTDVVLHEKTGKCYSGPVGTVNPGTNPGTTEFNDVSYENTISEKVDYKGRSVASRLDETKHLKDFWIPTDLDWTNAFERAAQASKDGGFVVQCPPGILTVSDSIVLYTDTTSMGGEFYKAKGSRFIGSPRGTTVKKTVVGSKPINATVFLEGGRGLQWTGIDIIDESENSYGIYGSVDVSFSEFRNLFISTKNWGMYFNNPVYVAVDIDNIVFAAGDTRTMRHGLRIPGGTTYRVGNVAAFGLVGDAFFLSGSYVEIGPLACDDCSGIPYTFSQLDGTISVLGVENINVPSIGTVIKVTESSSIKVDTVFLFKVIQPVNTSLIDYNAFGRIKIESIRGDSGTVLNGKITAVAGGGAVEVGYINKAPGQDSAGQYNIGNVAGTQYVQRYGNCEHKYLRLPEAPQNDTVVRYRILGQLNGNVGCLGTITEARGDGQYPRSGMYDINVIGGPTVQYARRVKRAVSDPTSNNYNSWYTGVYDGKTYILAGLDTNGTRNLGSYFSGIVDGTDPNLFKVVNQGDLTGLSPYQSGVILTETSS